MGCLRIVCIAALTSVSFPVIAADYLDTLPELRGTYEESWGFSDEPDPLDFELGLRYWYSMGSHAMRLGGDDYSSSDTSHILEMHFRVDDHSTASYLKGNVGYAAAIDGTYETPEFGSAQTMNGGTVGYGTADFGYMPFGNENISFGGFAGYQYLNDSPDMGRANYTTSGGGGASETNLMEFHQLRLGATAKANLGDWVDLNVEAAAIPYANLNGTYGALYIADFNDGGTDYVQGSAGNITGSLYGAAGEVMLGVHPTENVTLRVGGRAYYLTGDANVTFTAREDGAPGNEVEYISGVSGIQFFRYGLLAELTASF